MRGDTFYKDSWLMPNSYAYMLYNEWKKQTDPKLQKLARAKLDVHVKEVDTKYKQLSGISV